MRRTFGPVVLLGAAATAGAAISGAKPWVEPSSGDSQARAVAGFAATGADSGSVPLATSLALVALACWGVVLVTRGRFRRGVAALCLVASIGLLATVVWTWFGLADQVASDLSEIAGGTIGVSHTWWSWAGSAAAVVAVAAAAFGLRAVGQWPEMGSRYDAPTEKAPVAIDPDASNLDLWKAIDAGQDPTT